MKLKLIKLFVIILFPVIGYSQIETVDLLNKYERSEWLGYKYFDNNVNQKLIIYKSIDSILSNNPDKAITLRVSYYDKMFKKLTAKIVYDSAGIKEIKARRSLITFPAIIAWNIGEIPHRISKQFRKEKYIAFQDTTEKSFNTEGLIASMTNNRWSETYSYNKSGRLIEINCTLSQKQNDSTKVQLFCHDFASKWNGQYDNDGNLTTEVTYWTNDKKYESNHLFDNKMLVKSTNMELSNNEKQFKTYIYEKNLLKEIRVVSDKQKLLSKQIYRWMIK